VALPQVFVLIIAEEKYQFSHPHDSRLDENIPQKSYQIETKEKGRNIIDPRYKNKRFFCSILVSGRTRFIV
jgi:hypothetical protein